MESDCFITAREVSFVSPRFHGTISPEENFALFVSEIFRAAVEAATGSRTLQSTIDPVSCPRRRDSPILCDVASTFADVSFVNPLFQGEYFPEENPSDLFAANPPCPYRS